MTNMEEQRGKEPLAIRRATSEGDFVKNHLCNKMYLAILFSTLFHCSGYMTLEILPVLCECWNDLTCS